MDAVNPRAINLQKEEENLSSRSYVVAEGLGDF